MAQSSTTENGLPQAATPTNTDWVHAEALYYALFVVGFLSTLGAVTQRLWVRIRTQRGPRPEVPVDHGPLSDVFLLVAWVFSLATQIALVVLVSSKAVLVHIGDATAAQRALLPTAIYAAAPVYLMCTCFAKLSLLRLYMTLYPDSNSNSYRCTIWVVMLVVGLFTGILTGMLILACQPVRKSWEPSLEGSCHFSYEKLHITFAAGNAITEVACMVIPIPLIFKAKLSAMKKSIAVATLALSCSPFVTSIVRIFYIRKFYGGIDQTWDGAPVVLCIMIEANLYIICGCILSIRRIVLHLFRQTVDPSKNSTEATGNAAAPTDRLSSSSKQHQAKNDVQNIQPAPTQSAMSLNQKLHQRRGSVNIERLASIVSFSGSSVPNELGNSGISGDTSKSKSDSAVVAGIRKVEWLRVEDPESYHDGLREVARATTGNLSLGSVRRGSSFRTGEANGGKPGYAYDRSAKI